MSTPNTFRHFVGYFFRDTRNKLLLAFTGFFLLIFCPGMWAVDYFGTKRKYGYVPDIHSGGWLDSALIFGAILLAAWIGIIIYEIFKYKKYLNKNL